MLLARKRYRVNALLRFLPVLVLTFGVFAFSILGSRVSYKTSEASEFIRNGLLGEYFSDRTMQNAPVGVRIDKNIDFDWKNLPAYPGGPEDMFAIRWTGVLRPAESGSYTFYATADDGVRLWIDDKLVLDHWSWQSHYGKEVSSPEISLNALKYYSIRVEYSEWNSNARVQLSWSKDGGTKSVIPESVLFVVNALKAEYYKDREMSGSPADVGIVNTLRFDWGLDSANPNLPIDMFAVRYTGEIKPDVDGDYTFYATSDDGMRMWLDDKLIFDHWSWQSHYGKEMASSSVKLSASKLYKLKVEYNDWSKNANLSLSWKLGNGTKLPIPNYVFYLRGDIDLLSKVGSSLPGVTPYATASSAPAPSSSPTPPPLVGADPGGPAPAPAPAPAPVQCRVVSDVAVNNCVGPDGTGYWYGEDFTAWECMANNNRYCGVLPSGICGWMPINMALYEQCYAENSGPRIPPPRPVPVREYYISPNGSDSNNGSQSSPFKTIQRAINIEKTLVDRPPRIDVYLLPGVYRESVNIENYNSRPYLEIKGDKKAYVLGSYTSRGRNWVKTTDNLPFAAAASGKVYRLNVSDWPSAPLMAYWRKDGSMSDIEPMYIAREPDFIGSTKEKYHINFWKADGRVGTALNTLLDRTNDDPSSYPQAGSQAGNLRNINGFTNSFLAGGRLYSVDSFYGGNAKMNFITAHDAANGSVTMRDNYGWSTAPGYEAFSKYYVEGKPQLLDQAGEWYYDENTKNLYVWPLYDVNPATTDIEFSVNQSAFSITNSVGISVDGVNMYFQGWTFTRSTWARDGAVRLMGDNSNIRLTNNDIAYGGMGIRMYQNADGGKASTDIAIIGNKVRDMEGYAIVADGYPRDYVKYPFRLVNITGNEFTRAGFRVEIGDGMWIRYVDGLLFRNNIVSEMAHNGLEIHGARNTAILNNIFEFNCANALDCGGLKLWSGTNGPTKVPDYARNVLIANNITRNNIGWAYSNFAKSQWVTAKGAGLGASGIFLDGVASGSNNIVSVISFRNLAYNNTNGGYNNAYSSQDLYYGNVLVNNAVGLRFIAGDCCVNSSLASSAVNNYILNTETSKTGVPYWGTMISRYPANPYIPGVNANSYSVNHGYSLRYFYRGQPARDYVTINSLLTSGHTPVFETNGKNVALPDTLVANTNFNARNVDLAPFIAHGQIYPGYHSVIATLASQLSQYFAINIDLNSTVVGVVGN